jgi:hypothetical protein
MILRLRVAMLRSVNRREGKAFAGQTGTHTWWLSLPNLPSEREGCTLTLRTMCDDAESRLANTFEGGDLLAIRLADS